MIGIIIECLPNNVRQRAELLLSNLIYTVMLEHQKLIIKNVSQNSGMFIKEIVKSAKWLKISELIQLFEWLKDNFWQTHQKDIEEALLRI